MNRRDPYYGKNPNNVSNLLKECTSHKSYYGQCAIDDNNDNNNKKKS